MFGIHGWVVSRLELLLVSGRAFVVITAIQLHLLIFIDAFQSPDFSFVTKASARV